VAQTEKSIARKEPKYNHLGGTIANCGDLKRVVLDIIPSQHEYMLFKSEAHFVLEYPLDVSPWKIGFHHYLRM
jgi:hypothetical protein